MHTVIGLDIGGSKTHGIRAVDGRPVAEAFAGSANLASVGPAAAATQLDAVLTGLGVDHPDGGRPVGVDALCAGAAGADGSGGVAAVTRLLAERVPGARVRVVHDAHLLLAAGGVDAGVALISGTGSVAWGVRTDGADARAGGWGHLLGDEGSGYRVAVDAVRHTLDRWDRGEPPDPLGAAVLHSCGLTDPDQLIDFFYTRQDRGYWARHAPVVAELAGEGDPAAAAILAAAATALADLARRVRHRLDLPGPVVLGGGFAVHQPQLQEAVRAQLPDTDVRVLTQPPVDGAVRLATALADNRLVDTHPVEGAPRTGPSDRET